MYLSRLILNARSRAVQRHLADCQAMHRTVMSAFREVGLESSARAELRVLYRVDTNPRTGAVVVLVQSKDQPDWGSLPDGFLLDTGVEPENPTFQRVDSAYGGLEKGMVLRFRLRANPTKKINTKTGADGQRRNGARAELHGEVDLIAWITRKGGQCGFDLMLIGPKRDVPDVRAATEGKLTGGRHSRHGHEGGVLQDRLTLRTVLFEGSLRITDAELFRCALAQGIGPGKAYGCGLLSIARVSGEP